MSVLIFDDVSLAFGEQQILKQANFVLEARERVCLIGRNGAGKTSAFRLISGEVIADSGEIRISSGIQVSQLIQSLPNELDSTVHAYVAKGLASLQADIDEYEALSQKELDAGGLAELSKLQRSIEAHGGWHIDQQVESVLSELGLPPEHKLSELSGGWQRRVALARALVNQPDLLLLDEPFSAVDPITRLGLYERFESVQKQNQVSTLLVTHDLREAKRLAGYLLILDQGVVVQAGTPEDVLEHPATAYVERLIESQLA